MATKSTQNKNTSKKTNTSKNTKKGTKNSGKDNQQQDIMKEEIVTLSLLAISIIILISNFGLAGFIGNAIAGVNFGVFGLVGHVFPFCLFAGAIYFYVFRKNKKVYIKLAAGLTSLVSICSILQLFTSSFKGQESILSFYTYGREYRAGGGLLGGIITKALYPALGAVGSMVVFIILLIISFVLITEKSFISVVKTQGGRAAQGVAQQRDRSAANRNVRRAESQVRREEALAREEEENRLKLEEIEKRRREIPVRGVTFDTTLKPQESTLKELSVEPISSQNIEKPVDVVKPLHEMNEVEAFHSRYNEEPKTGLWEEDEEDFVTEQNEYTMGVAPISDSISEPVIEVEPLVTKEPVMIEEPVRQMEPSFEPEIVAPTPEKKISKKESQAIAEQGMAEIDETIAQSLELEGAYKFPPIDLLSPGPAASRSGDQELRETAIKLEDTLNSFGVKVKVTEYSKGPSVTRYELQPEKGVKVSKIVGLVDDIKLNLAAADIRIEAPIPGKAAVGIEVPNKENSVVALRTLLESPQFQSHESNIAFAAGKDIGGQAVVTDIGKMPHVLIAGSTGSGKSVCINTLIMSILYKANPEDVKLIMIDPKVVELSVYNGIPHLLIPVVTDPKKAAGALHWAVAEMTKRYQLFAEYNVRDLKGYNEKIKSIEHIEDETKPEKMPQIVVIVDELADLMMVAPGDVEEAICRLAQLARAAGIHLILATQRPSVNVITGLIKANMPSRIAFAVSSGVDSRTIIDMNGAEKLLGKGDMLFYPAGYPKPARVQGAFVSDKEVHAVVQYLIEQQGETVYSDEIQKEVSSSASNVGAQGGMSGANADELDSYFVEAGKFIIEKDKASIGMLQRSFKVGFNRAARIMDQLADAGVVGEEEGTKPRKVLMSISEFEQYIEDYV